MYVYDANSRPAAYLRGSHLYAHPSGRPVGYVRGESVWNMRGVYVGELGGGRLLDKIRTKGPTAPPPAPPVVLPPVPPRVVAPTVYRDATGRLLE